MILSEVVEHLRSPVPEKMAFTAHMGQMVLERSRDILPIVTRRRTWYRWGDGGGLLLVPN